MRRSPIHDSYSSGRFHHCNEENRAASPLVNILPQLASAFCAFDQLDANLETLQEANGARGCRWHGLGDGVRTVLARGHKLLGQRRHRQRCLPGVGASPITGFVNTIRETFGYAQTMIGNFGWLDTPAPLAVYFSWSVLVGALILVGFSVFRGRSLLLGSVLIALFLLLPPIIQGAYITGGGMIWQGRYTLPLFTLLVLGLAVRIAERLGSIDGKVLSRITFLAWLVWLIGQYLSFATALKRYTVGADDSWREALLTPEWQAPGGNVLWLVSFGLILTTAAVTAWRLGLSSSQSQPLSRVVARPQART